MTISAVSTTERAQYGSHFTGKERDPESGLDDFGARYFNSNMGRFQSADWAQKAEPAPYSKLDNPQTLNLYSYVENNPESSPDLDGHDGSEVDQFNQTFDDAMASACTGGISTACGSQEPGQAGSPSLTQSEQVSENRYVSIINDDYDPAGVAHDTIQWHWEGGNGTRDDNDRKYVALAVGLAWAKKQEGGPPAPAAIQELIQKLYDKLTLYGMGEGQSAHADYDDNNHVGLHGGNWNFNSDILINLGFNKGRNGVLPSIHIEGPGKNGDHFHVDTANGSSVAGPIHWFWDVLLGTYLQDFHDNGIPR